MRIIKAIAGVCLLPVMIVAVVLLLVLVAVLYREPWKGQT